MQFVCFNWKYKKELNKSWLWFLVSFKSSVFKKKVTNLWAVVNFHKTRHVFIFCLWSIQEGQYKWIDGFPLTYTDWYRNEPTEDGCAAMTLDGWADLPCNEQHAYFCKTTQGNYCNFVIEIVQKKYEKAYVYCERISAII